LRRELLLEALLLLEVEHGGGGGKSVSAGVAGRVMGWGAGAAARAARRAAAASPDLRDPPRPERRRGGRSRDAARRAPPAGGAAGGDGLAELPVPARPVAPRERPFQEVGQLDARAAAVADGRAAEPDLLVVQHLDGVGALAVALDADREEVARDRLLEADPPGLVRLLDGALGDGAVRRPLVDDEDALAAVDAGGGVLAGGDLLPDALAPDRRARLGPEVGLDDGEHLLQRRALLGLERRAAVAVDAARAEARAEVAREGRVEDGVGDEDVVYRKHGSNVTARLRWCQSNSGR